jgi:hypothetical protein
VKDLAALVDDLPLLPGVAIVHEHVDLRQGVERDRVRIDPRLDRVAGSVRADLPLELVHRLGARAR